MPVHTLRLLATSLTCLLVIARLSVSSLALPQAPAQWERWTWVEPQQLDRDVTERLLTAYDAGRYEDFDRLLGPVTASVINPFEFEADAERWIEAGTDRRRRALIAAAVALELATAPRPRRADTSSALTDVMVTEVRFILSELGCVWLRDHSPARMERSWHVAFVALARATGQEERIIQSPVTQPEPDPSRNASQSNRGRPRQSLEPERQTVHQEVVARLRRHASRVGRSSRIAAAPRADDRHAAHLLARFPDDRFPVFLEATVRERALASFPETLLGEASAPTWIDAADVERIAARGALQIRTLPPNLRMDRRSAERLLRVAPEPVTTVVGQAVIPIVWQQPPSAAVTSLVLWDVIDRLQVVAARGPLAAEAWLRLGQNYPRLARPDLALPAFARAESLAATAYERYLARLFAGSVFVRSERRPEAITAFQGALDAVPRAQAASLALAPLLIETDAAEEAAEMVEAAMRQPLVNDPLSFYYEGDPTAISRALAQLREETRR